MTSTDDSDSLRFNTSIVPRNRLFSVAVSWLGSGWNDGDPLLYGYLGHPIQGALTSYIQIQNDPRGDGLEFSNTREY